MPLPATPAVTDKTPEEPQNALTKKFTEQEWTAVKEFRVRLMSLSHF